AGLIGHRHDCLGSHRRATVDPNGVVGTAHSSHGVTNFKFDLVGQTGLHTHPSPKKSLIVVSVEVVNPDGIVHRVVHRIPRTGDSQTHLQGHGSQILTPQLRSGDRVDRKSTRLNSSHVE